MSKTQIKYKVENNIVYSATTKGGWAITIMPEEIVIDNYHSKGGHIHPKPENHDIEIKIKHNAQIPNLNLVFTHLKRHKGLKLEKLIKELK
jgi:hypothetical protein